MVLTLAALAMVAPSGGVDARPGDQYVSLGDSYTAGPLIPRQVAPFGGLKSNRNYPNVVNATLGGAAFRDVSCSGATTDDMFTAQSITEARTRRSWTRCR